MLSPDIFMAFVVGVIVGVGGTMICLRCGIKSVGKELRRMEEEKERNDPANWWKYGGKPFGHDEDHGIA